MLVFIILIVLAALPAVAFPIVYWSTSKWYRSNLGRSLMLNGVSIALIMSLVLFTVLHGPDYPGRAVIRVGVYGLIATMLWVQLITYLGAVRKVRREQKKKENDVSQGT